MAQMNLEIGIVTQVDISAEAVTARVSIAERGGIVSPPLYILQQGSKETKSLWLPAINEQVIFMRFEGGASGVILGSVYSARDTTAAELQSDTTRGVVFPDGSMAVWDDGKLTVETTKDVIVTSAAKVTVDASTEIKATVGTTEVKLTGSKIKIATAAGSLKGILDSILDAAIAETHTTPLGPTSPPINVASYVAAKVTVGLVFE